MLTLPIKKKWFDMMINGVKTEEYRNATKYYYTRFNNLFDALDTDIKPILFRNGYSADSPSFVANCSFLLGTGREEWGAEKGKEYYVFCIEKYDIIEA